MNGPKSVQAWMPELKTGEQVLGLSPHPLLDARVVEVFLPLPE